MKLPHSTAARSRDSAFTMVEIALCLAIIGLGLVAILGVLPHGTTTQRDTRWETLINEDGLFWLNAIRTGAREALDLKLVDYVTALEVDRTTVSYAKDADIIGALSRPGTTNRARVRVLSASAAEQSVNSEVGLEYYLFSTVLPFDSGNALLSSNLHEIRLVFRWPAFPNGGFGNSKKVFRTLVRGELTETNGLFFFNNYTLIQP